jgi:hypothetical protein
MVGAIFGIGNSVFEDPPPPPPHPIIIDKNKIVIMFLECT